MMDPEQMEHAQAAVMPKPYMRFKVHNDLGDLRLLHALHEPDDMVIVVPPCHGL